MILKSFFFQSYNGSSAPPIRFMRTCSHTHSIISNCRDYWSFNSHLAKAIYSAYLSIGRNSIAIALADCTINISSVVNASKTESTTYLIKWRWHIWTHISWYINSLRLNFDIVHIHIWLLAKPIMTIIASQIVLIVWLLRHAHCCWRLFRTWWTKFSFAALFREAINSLLSIWLSLILTRETVSIIRQANAATYVHLIRGIIAFRIRFTVLIWATALKIISVTTIWI